MNRIRIRARQLFTYLDGSVAPMSFSDVPHEIPNQPTVVRVLSSQIYTRPDHRGLVVTVSEPHHLLVCHGFSHNGAWTCRNGFEILTALGQIEQTGIRIRGLAVCNPGRFVLPGRRYFYASGTPLVSFSHVGQGFRFQICPNGENDQMVVPPTPRIKLAARIKFTS